MVQGLGLGVQDFRVSVGFADGLRVYGGPRRHEIPGLLYSWLRRQEVEGVGAHRVGELVLDVLGEDVRDVAGREEVVQEHLRFRVQGSGFRVQGSGCRVQGSGCRVQGTGFRVGMWWIRFKEFPAEF